MCVSLSLIPLVLLYQPLHCFSLTSWLLSDDIPTCTFHAPIIRLGCTTQPLTQRNTVCVFPSDRSYHYSRLRQEISAFLNRVEQPFNDEDLVLLAATHRSWTRIVEVEKEGRGSVESWVGPPVDNNRLSSLGNAALKTALTQYIFVRYPNLDGESITRITNHLASNEILSLAARNVGYQHLLRCRRAAVVKTDHPDSKRIVADSFSAFVGAGTCCGLRVLRVLRPAYAGGLCATPPPFFYIKNK